MNQKTDGRTDTARAGVGSILNNNKGGEREGGEDEEDGGK